MGTVPKYQCGGKCALTAKPDAATLDKLETGFRNLFESDSASLLKKHLPRELFDNLKFKKSKFGSTLLDCIQSGLENLDSGVGVYAPDPDAYITFADLFDPIIEDYHNGFTKSDTQPPKDFGDPNSLSNLDPTGNFVVSIRIRCGRTLEGYPFNPCLTENQYLDIEKKVGIALSSLDGELKGIYNPLCSMDPDVQQKLIDTNYLYKTGDRFLQAANSCRFWPVGRGIFFNEDKTFLVWVNEEDHVRIISMQAGGDLAAVYRRFVTGVTAIENKLLFIRSDRLGALTFCPTNLGTSIRASVHIKIPKLAKKKEKLEEFSSKYNLQVRGTSGEHSESIGDVYDVSNKLRMGLTEFACIKILQDGILELIKLEKSIKVRKKRKPTWRELARRRLARNPVLERLKWPKFLPSYLYKI